LFDTLPIERPHELSFVFWGPRIDGLSGMYSDGRLDPATGKQMSSNISFPAYQELQQLQRPGVSLAAFTFIPRTNVVIPGRSPEGATGILADGTFFNVVRPPMAMGRGLTPSDVSRETIPVIWGIGHRVSGDRGAALFRIRQVRTEQPPASPKMEGNEPPLLVTTCPIREPNG
jgi:hypothetical protein